MYRTYITSRRQTVTCRKSFDYGAMADQYVLDELLARELDLKEEPTDDPIEQIFPYRRRNAIFMHHTSLGGMNLTAKLSGLSQETIDTIKSSNVTQETEKDCVICIEQCLVGEWTRTLHCAHFFHRHCIDPWLRVQNNCPICRNPAAVLL